MITRSIQEIDKNFVPAAGTPDDVEYLDIFQPPFVIDGLYQPCQTGKFCRLPQELLPLSNEGVQNLAWHTSGGRLRFATDSPYLAIAVQLNGVVHMMHMPRTGNSGFDLYTGPRGAHAGDQRFVRAFFPSEPVKESGACYDGCHTFAGGEAIPREVTLNFPLYNGFQKLLIGLKKGASVWAPAPYSVEKPVLFYGSSITQGGCASRPGNNYVNHLSRWLDCNFICLGFSGSARGEESMARHIASLDLSAFVMDYDHNAPDAAYLERTHYPFYQAIREAQPQLPILMVSKPDFDNGREQNARRRDIVLESYLRGREAGDGRLWFVDGESLFLSRDRDACTVDGCHPNDLGFYRMAQTIYPKLKAALGL